MFFGFGQENLVGEIGSHTGAIARLAVSVHSSAVSHIIDRIKSQPKNTVAGLTPYVGNDTNAASISLQLRPVQ